MDSEIKDYLLDVCTKVNYDDDPRWLDDNDRLLLSAKIVETEWSDDDIPDLLLDLISENGSFMDFLLSMVGLKTNAVDVERYRKSLSDSFESEINCYYRDVIAECDEYYSTTSANDEYIGKDLGGDAA